MRTLKVYYLNKFQSYNIILSIIVTVLYIRLSEFIHFITDCTLLPTSLHFPNPQPLATTILLYFYEFNFYILDFTFTWYHVVFVFFYMAYFSQHNALQVHLCCKVPYWCNALKSKSFIYSCIFIIYIYSSNYK